MPLWKVTSSTSPEGVKVTLAEATPVSTGWAPKASNWVSTPWELTTSSTSPNGPKATLTNGGGGSGGGGGGGGEGGGGLGDGWKPGVFGWESAPLFRNGTNVTTPSGSMILSPVPPGLAGVVGPVNEPQKLLVASRVPVYAPASSSSPAVALPAMWLAPSVMFWLAPANPSLVSMRTRTPRVAPLSMKFSVIARLLTPPTTAIWEPVEAVIVLRQMATPFAEPTKTALPSLVKVLAETVMLVCEPARV